MLKSKSPWGELPNVAQSLQGFFHAKPVGECKSLPLSTVLLKDVLDCIPAVRSGRRHYTQDMRDELSQMSALDKAGYVAVKVTEFVLLQKDIELLLKSEINSAKPDVEYISCLREVTQKLADVREKASQNHAVVPSGPLPTYTNDC